MPAAAIGIDEDRRGSIERRVIVDEFLVDRLRWPAAREHFNGDARVVRQRLLQQHRSGAVLVHAGSMARPAGDQHDPRRWRLLRANRGDSDDQEESNGQSTKQHGGSLRRSAKVTIDGMTQETGNVVSVNNAAAKLADGVLDLARLEPIVEQGCRVFVHYNGPTDQLSGLCAGHGGARSGRQPSPAAPPS